MKHKWRYTVGMGLLCCFGILTVFMYAKAAENLIFLKNQLQRDSKVVKATWKVSSNHHDYQTKTTKTATRKPATNAPTAKTTKTTTKLSSNKATTQQTHKPSLKRILIWDDIWWFKQTAVEGPTCGFCPLSRNRSLVYDKDTAAVVINAWSRAPSDPPVGKERRPDQLFIFWASESQSKTQFFGDYKVNLRLYPPNFFNATFTFRRDSTFYGPTARLDLVNMIRSGWHGVERNLTRLLSKKNRTALFVVSNCNYGSNTIKRLQIAQEMVDLGFKVDRYGRCFPGRKFQHKKFRESPSFFRVVETYKFYLSFENSLHCRDYITEKFLYNALASGAIPVAHGGRREDYAAIAPPKSYILVEDFNNTGELVNYLNYLDRNQTAYAEYFEWRKGYPRGFYRQGKPLGFCAICRTLHGIALNDTRPFDEVYGSKGERYPPKTSPGFAGTVPSIHEWWHGGESPECMNVTWNNDSKNNSKRGR